MFPNSLRGSAGLAHGENSVALLNSHSRISISGVIGSKMGFAVTHIVGVRNGLKVFWSIVVAYAVFVVNLVPFWNWAMKCLVHKPMDAPMNGFTVNEQVSTQVPVLGYGRDQHARLSEYALRIYFGLCSKFARRGQFVKLWRDWEIVPSFHRGKLYHVGNWPAPSI